MTLLSANQIAYIIRANNKSHSSAVLAQISVHFITLRTAYFY